MKFIIPSQLFQDVRMKAFEINREMHWIALQPLDPYIYVG